MANIREVAKKAGVSVGAVSRILNNDPTLSVTDATKERVFLAAKELNYQKPVNKRTSYKSAFKLGVVQWFSTQDTLNDNYYLKMRQGIEDFCQKNKIEMIRVFPNDASSFSKLKNVNGLICLGKFSREEIATFTKICSNTVFLDMQIPKSSITSLTMDFEQAVYQSLNHFVSLNHHDIAFLGGQEYVGNNEAILDPRCESFKKYMQHRNMYNPSLVKIGSFSTLSGYKMMNELFEEKNIPTAIFAANDAIAYGAMKAIAEHGYKIPQDISIIGFNDEDMSSFVNPPLTTVHAPCYDMGQHGANLVYVASNLSIKTPLRAKIPCKLIIRESTCRR